MKKFISSLLSVILILPVFTCGSGAISIEEGKEALIEQFQYGKGPKANGYTIDYRYYSPVKETDGDLDESEESTELCEDEQAVKYPLVVWVHGHSHGQYDGYQIESNAISNWASDEYQARFGEKAGAYIMAVRAPEEKGVSWDKDMVLPLKLAIDDFILKNIETVDTTKIYIGGFSLGGMMTFKMAAAYPEMFAAIFPICPYTKISADEAGAFSDVPVWLTSAKNDALVSYRFKTLKNWKVVCKTTSVAEQCRLSTLSKVRYPDGTITPSAHYSWEAVTADMFSSTNGDYPYMTTVDGNGNTVNLVYPNGIISWMSQFSSDYQPEDVKLTGVGTGNDKIYLFKPIKNALMVVYIFFRNLLRPICLVCNYLNNY